MVPSLPLVLIKAGYFSSNHRLCFYLIHKHHLTYLPVAAYRRDTHSTADVRSMGSLLTGSEAKSKAPPEHCVAPNSYGVELGPSSGLIVYNLGSWLFS